MRNSKDPILQIYGVTATPTCLFIVTERLIVAWMVKNFMHYVRPEHSLKIAGKTEQKNHLERFGTDGKTSYNCFSKRNLSYREN